ncbi:hypothetical protein TrST_g4029 [Triparma strigata]|uniref:Uncharacterized protein n=1 Tax=Triparma strigata TaxID=1606541 RepID=A0A9W7EY73_9STRA|nr:hypothetical protein TrST_g4029 [Triparma strigata]
MDVNQKLGLILALEQLERWQSDSPPHGSEFSVTILTDFSIRPRLDQRTRQARPRPRELRRSDQQNAEHIREPRSRLDQFRLPTTRTFTRNLKLFRNTEMAEGHARGNEGADLQAKKGPLIRSVHQKQSAHSSSWLLP